ncbi:hypothetical protein RE628_11355 [Paenibacillus sp. D2_2]|uniref:hypothetical protein n=1 Tax=Paenibacillus sp. D2_2 TaxID=3073092 RepID=UPI002814CF78|nr:hypothetical protein [Paenibacillus sp. D2_2]WMT42824.1 hypothetical protein RE628_11355 [Paenibacillus sp. D2_2]
MSVNIVIVLLGIWVYRLPLDLNKSAPVVLNGKMQKYWLMTTSITMRIKAEGHRDDRNTQRQRGPY